jgi:hypothetical protein
MLRNDHALILVLRNYHAFSVVLRNDHAFCVVLRNAWLYMLLEKPLENILKFRAWFIKSLKDRLCTIKFWKIQTNS